MEIHYTIAYNLTRTIPSCYYGTCNYDTLYCIVINMDQIKHIYIPEACWYLYYIHSLPVACGPQAKLIVKKIFCDCFFFFNIRKH